MGLDLNLGLPELEARVLFTRPRRSLPATSRLFPGTPCNATPLFWEDVLTSGS
jgi:hypothetical protein